MSVLRLDILDRAESVGIGWVFWCPALYVRACTFTWDSTHPCRTCPTGGPQSVSPEFSDVLAWDGKEEMKVSCL